MRIGIDLDNTQINYFGVFHKVAVLLKWLDPAVGKDKQSVKDSFYEREEGERWTELQGIVYGKHIQVAQPYPHLADTLKIWQERGWQLFVVSHKTQYPFLGEKVDLHEAAQAWLQQNQLLEYFESVHFCTTKDEKVNTIAQLQLDVFIDDLPEILNHAAFPKRTTGVLFDPEGNAGVSQHRVVNHWAELINGFHLQAEL